MPNADSTTGFVPKTNVIVRLPNGAQLGIPVAGQGSGDVAGFGGVPTLAELRETLEGVFQLLAPLAEKALPGKTTVELGFEFSCEAGKVLALLVEGSTTANVKVTFEWER